MSDEDDDELEPSPALSTFPPVPTDPNDPAVSFINNQGPIGDPLNSGADVYGLPLYSPAHSYYLFSGSSPYSTPGTSQHPQLSFVPPAYVAGEFEGYIQNVEHGNSETQQQSLISFGPYLQPVYKPGELSHYGSTVGHGNVAMEAKEQWPLPYYYYPSQGFWESPGFPHVAQSVPANRNHPFLFGYAPPQLVVSLPLRL